MSTAICTHILTAILGAAVPISSTYFSQTSQSRLNRDMLRWSEYIQTYKERCELLGEIIAELEECPNKTANSCNMDNMERLNKQLNIKYYSMQYLPNDSTAELYVRYAKNALADYIDDTWDVDPVDLKKKLYNAQRVSKDAHNRIMCINPKVLRNELQNYISRE